VPHGRGYDPGLEQNSTSRRTISIGVSIPSEMLLHLIPDEKFIDVTREQFDAVAPNRNLFLAYKKLPETPCTYAQVNTYAEVTSQMLVLPQDPDAIFQVAKTSENLEAVLVHSLNAVSSRAVVLIRREFPKIPIVWLSWGHDVYEAVPSLQRRLYSPATLKHLKRRWPAHSLLWHARLLLESSLNRLGLWCKPDYVFYRDAIKAITFCAPVFPTEERLIRKHCGFEGQFLRFTYGFHDQDDAVVPMGDRQNILVGNSATATCNHVDAFKILRNLRLGDRKVIVPLSYGDANYRELVARTGKNLLGDSFMPIFDFLPLARYSALIRTCGTLILNHRRQQAGGNILMGLWNGAKIYLTEENPAYSHLRSLGAHLFSFDRELNQMSIQQPLADSVVERNRSVVRQYYGREAVIRRGEKLVATLVAGRQGKHQTIR
jgi:dTDP-N-acetylfucosamine:lipid II N-acetylfucosaminyltransferase